MVLSILGLDKAVLDKAVFYHHIYLHYMLMVL